MKILFFGDVMGRAARLALMDALPDLRARYGVDFAVVNGENAAGGFGITPEIANGFFDAGADVVTSGNHIWDQRETMSHIVDEGRLLRPCNYPDGTPGRGSNLFMAGDKQVLVINVMLQLFMETLDDPFRAVEAALAACPLGEVADAIIVDIHGEATSEKMAMGHFCDGRASLVVGTHTHVPTADAQILPEGTAYQTDAGMCGDYDSVIGMEKDEPVQRFTTKLRGGRFVPAQGAPTLCGVYVETDDQTGLATHIEPIRMGGRLAQHLPSR